ncbi:MAG: response regulator [Polyangia bacterium]
MTKLLLVEDNEMNMDMLKRLCVRASMWSPLPTESRVFWQVRLERPDLVLMDLSLPILDGWEATRRLKADPTLRDIPVIALTAHAMAEDLGKATAAGCDDFDTKPVDIARLLTKVRAQLAKRGHGWIRSTHCSWSTTILTIWICSVVGCAKKATRFCPQRRDAKHYRPWQRSPLIWSSWM